MCEFLAGRVRTLEEPYHIYDGTQKALNIVHSREGALSEEVIKNCLKILKSRKAFITELLVNPCL